MSESNKSNKRKVANDPSDSQPEGAAEASAIADQPAGALTRAAETAKDVGGRTAAAVAEQYGRATRGVQEAYRVAVSAGTECEDGLERYVRRNPVTSMLVTAGVSLLLGFALGRQTAEPPPRRSWWQS